jgi:tetratricopeptide (TPR) repeat protein
VVENLQRFRMAKVVKKKGVVAQKKKKSVAVPKRKKPVSIPKRIEPMAGVKKKKKKAAKMPPPVRFSKKKKKKASSGNIEKKPLTEEERKTKIKDDLLNIAKRYERMLLYDDAIKYYKKLGMTEDIERLMKTKEETYIKKAQEFEAQHQYEDALRLYENLKRTEDVERLNKFLGKSDFVEDPEKSAQQQPQPAEPDIHPPDSLEPVTSKEQIPQDAALAPGTMSKDDEPKEIEMIAPPTDELDIPPKGVNKIEDTLFREAINEDQSIYPEEQAQEENKVPELTLTQELIPPQPPKPDEPAGPVYAEKAFKICPYCGEELNLPKKPNFCPYCKERLI